MKEHSEESPDWDDQRMKIIGLGESSIRKSYYPELQQRLQELEQSNADLLDAIEEIQQKEEELRQNYDEQRNIQSALDLARKKLNLLNSLTFQDIQNALFSLSGYLTLTKEAISGEPVQMYLEKSLSQMQKSERVLHIAKQYQNMGIHPPKWQNVMEVYVFAVSHLDMSAYERNISLEGLEIFADPLLEDAFFYLLENIKYHSVHATGYQFYYESSENEISLILEDNGIGIESDRKEKVFERRTGLVGGIGLFLVREILSITDMTICENGQPGKGARFKITVPRGVCRMKEIS
ncbi:MAG: sensor protein KdpD [Euryarchaeota archaeon ADurb.Bin294]|nr:MAG: sensor protein KdpD [Euryarchaeota archaeon ADurb.Bin294]